MIGHKQIPSREGGVEVAVEALSTRMAAAGHDVTVYNRGIPKSGEKPKAHKGVRVRYVPVIAKRGAAAFTGTLSATLAALTGHYDCIHYHAEGPAAMVFLPHLLGIRTVVTIHGLDWKRSKWGRFASAYLRSGERCAAKYADEVIVLSHAMQAYFRDTYDRETVYIPNGVDPVETPDDTVIRETFGLVRGDYILYLGRIVPEKGLSALIDAFRRTKTDKKLVLAGGASDTEGYLQALRRQAAGDDRILFTGFVEGDVLDSLYTNCYLYCLPSELEGMPISLLEAMRYGAPCLCSDIPECTEVIAPNGFTFRAGDTDDLARVLGALCDDPARVEACRRQMGKQSFDRHNWDDVTHATLSLYEKQ